jgi:putative ABC transport system ATP-binding protein
LLPILTVQENIMLPFLLDGRKPEQSKFDEIVKMIGLEERLNHLPSELSGGQQQRVSVGRALINQPAVILADEPTGNLDSKSGGDVIELLTSANKKLGQTLVMITHDDRVAAAADRIVRISDGKVLA